LLACCWKYCARTSAVYLGCKMQLAISGKLLTATAALHVSALKLDAAGYVYGLDDLKWPHIGPNYCFAPCKELDFCSPIDMLMCIL
jgi:hypothetical protein